MMKRNALALFACVGILSYGAYQLAAAPQQTAAPAAPWAAERALVDKYCISCHSQRAKTAGLVLEGVDWSNVPAKAEMWEKVIRKVRGGIMPPAGVPHPDKAAADALATSLETALDKAYFAKVNPGRVGVHRLNRAEYGNAIKDVLGLDTDVASLLPADDSNYGFDNIADALTMSPLLMERYLTAAWKVTGIAVGDMKITPVTDTFRIKPDASQDRHVEGLPLGTRGGIAVKYNFPLDAEYRFKVRFWGNTVNTVRGLELPHQVEVTIDGNRVRLATIGGQEDADFGNVNPTASAEALAKRVEIQIPVTAGPHVVGVAFLAQTSGPSIEILQPYQREKLDPINTSGIPELDWVSISGPFNAKSPGDTPSRRQIFTCRPTAGADEVPCARRILSTLARRAYRRTPNVSEMERLLGYFQQGRNSGGNFDSGIQHAAAFVLVSPQFLFRVENEPDSVAPGSVYRLSDVDLASRLSFFLWSSVPDDQLLDIANKGKLKDPVVLEQQVRRMLADPKADALVNNFLGQWLYLRNLKGTVPDPQIFPDFHDNLRQAFLRETELFAGSIMREERSVLDLLNADYTFVNERLAKHYGIPGVYGGQFRKVQVSDVNRRGLLGHGSVLTVTSYANRTSPVLRGKWVLTNILGTPPPPPPPNVPALKDVAVGSMRERMEQHRSNPACFGCHSMMDPVGFALENFDGVGHWRTRDQGSNIDTSGAMPDGFKLNGPAALRQAITAQPRNFVGTVTEMLATYALGRGLEYYDMPVVRSVVRGSAKGNYKFSDIVLGIVKAPPFQMRVKAAPATTVALAK